MPPLPSKTIKRARVTPAHWRSGGGGGGTQLCVTPNCALSFYVLAFRVQGLPIHCGARQSPRTQISKSCRWRHSSCISTPALASESGADTGLGSVLVACSADESGRYLFSLSPEGEGEEQCVAWGLKFGA